MKGTTPTAAMFAASVALLAAGAAAQTSLPRVLAWEESLRGEDDGELRWPVAVAHASEQEFAVADALKPRVLLFRRVGGSWQVETAASLPGTPVALTHDGTRYVAALREGQGLVALEGARLLQRPIGLPRGVVAGAIAAGRDGRLLVHDHATGSVLELGGAGDVERRTPIEGLVTALAAAPAGGFYAALGAEGTIVQHDGSGARVATLRVPGAGPVPAWPAAIAVDPGKGLAVVDRHGCRVVFLDGEGRPTGTGSRPGAEPGLLKFPAAISRSPDGRLVVADGGNGRVQIFQRTDRGLSP